MFPLTAHYKSQYKSQLPRHSHMEAEVEVINASYQNGEVFMYHVVFRDCCKIWVAPWELTF